METQHHDLSLSLSLSCDDSYISLLFADDEPTDDPMSDETYAEKLQLQEAIMSSLIHLPNAAGSSPPKKPKLEIGESSSSAQSQCEICVESKNADEFFPLKNCIHRFCTSCVSKHVSIRIRKGITGERLNCPGEDCKGFIDVGACRGIVPDDIVDAWDERLCEAMISAEEKFRCPYKSCSRLVARDGGGVVKEAECPYCHRLFCVECRVPWHAGIDCMEFARLPVGEREREDVMVHELAKKEGWKRCPKCNFFVEKTEGCLHITCMCLFEFCYKCGGAWSSSHGC